jgi:hypothetical protein
MTTTHMPLEAPKSWGRQAEAWLDGYGKPAWIAAMVLGFILFWPVGLAILFYMIWGKKMFGKSCRKSAHHANAILRPSGNTAFDAYKSDMLRRLEDEQAAFDAFLARLREAKDKSEFDMFMDENRRRRDEQRALQE